MLDSLFRRDNTPDEKPKLQGTVTVKFTDAQSLEAAMVTATGALIRTELQGWNAFPVAFNLRTGRHGEVEIAVDLTASVT